MAIYTIPTAKTPVMSYIIKVNDVDIALSSNTVVSFRSPYNKVNITLKATANAPKYIEGRLTKADANWDIGVGTLLYYDGSIPLNTDCNYSFDVNSTNFTEGDGIYRVSLYAQSALDGTWDIYTVFLSATGINFIPNNSDGLEVLTEKEI